PRVELTPSLRSRQMQPVAVVRQIEHAGAARNRTAMPDGVQELTFFQWVDDVRAGGRELAAELLDVVDQAREPARVDARLAAIAVERGRVPLELLQHVGANVT